MISRLFKSLRASLRANFFAGLFIAVPFAVTMGILLWLWKLIDDPLIAIFKIASRPEGMPWERLFKAIEDGRLGDERVISAIVSLCIVALAVLIVGIVARSIIGRMALAGLEAAVERMPLVGLIYSSLRQMSDAFAASDGASKFQRVVAVQFPYKGCWAIGFVTGQATTFLPQLCKAVQEPTNLISVVIPSTPFPTTSFMVIVPENETIQLNIAVKDALKLVISGGVLNPGDSHRLRMDSEVERLIRESNSVDVARPSKNAKADV